VVACLENNFDLSGVRICNGMSGAGPSQMDMYNKPEIAKS